MPDKTETLRAGTALIQGLLLACALFLAALCYWPGLGADFHFDEFPSLAPLAEVGDTLSAADYVVSGTAGPTGRPLSLASFLIDRAGWPDSPSKFIYTNILLHLLNGLLLMWFALRLGQSTGLPRDRAGYLGIAAGALWLSLPILASAPLLVVQRMTLLSASFVLLGLLAFLTAHRQLPGRPRASLAAMSAAVIVFTLLATLAKENGALLPVFILVLSGLLSPPQALSRRAWRAWKAIFLWLPGAAVLAIILLRAPYPETTVLARDFTAAERLMTQAVVLWEYLLHAFVPIDTAALGPFHDDYQPARSLLQPAVALAVTGWAVVLAVAIARRRQWPWFSFAVFWFLGGHLLESTLIPLDLYFEHRNYMPLAGPAIAIAWGLVNVPVRWRRPATGAFVGYCALLALTLWLVTSLWGSPFREAQVRAAESPQSSRAVGYLVGHFLAQEWIVPAKIVLDSAIERGVSPARFRLLRTALDCQAGEQRNSPHLERLGNELPDERADSNFASTLFWLAHHYLDECELVQPSDIRAIADRAEQHPYYRESEVSRYWLHRARALAAAADHDADLELRHLQSASRQRFSPPVLDQLTDIYAARGDLDAACELIGEAMAEMPSNPVRRLHRRFALERLAAKVDCSSGRDSN